MKILYVFIPIFIALSCFHISMAYENEIERLSASMIGKISQEENERIAVTDFTDLQGRITEFGRFIAEEISVNLTIAAKKFEVIDRIHLGSILKEHKLSASGLVNPDTIKELGQIAGVEAILTGSFIPFDNSVRVTVKVIATDTAKVISAIKGNIPRTKAINELLAKGIDPETDGSTPDSSGGNSKSSKNYFDSGWVADNNSTNHSTVFKHDFGIVPKTVSVWFSPDRNSSSAYPIIWGWDQNYSGNPVTVEATPVNIILHIWSGQSLHGIWRPNQNWLKFNSGFWRIYAWK